MSKYFDLRAAGRILLFCLIISLIKPDPILVVVGERREVVTAHPIVGVHTRLTDEVEPWKIRKTLEMVREMGAEWIVEFFPWAYYHAADGGFAWSHPDLVVNHAHAQGLKIIARIGLTPDWARPADTPLTYLDHDGYDDFAVFAAAFAERYKDKVHYIIVGNEPNLSYEWGYRSTTAEDYVSLLRVVYPRIKAASQETMVLAGALAPNLEPEGSPWATNDLVYLQDFYDAGAKDFFDGLAVHAYGLTFPPEAPADPALLNFRRVELVREIMIKNGDSSKGIYVTESGWNDHPRWSRAVRPAQRIQYTLDALNFAESNWPFTQVVALWAFRYPGPTLSYPDYYTLVTPEFVPKPIYYSLQLYTGN